MNVLSLFSGIGGLELGLERAGMTVVGQVEIDPYCRRALAKHWPEVPRHDDVRTAVEWWRGGHRPEVAVLCGGFPCPTVSLAGKRLGRDDPRWLWPVFADVIRALRPRYVVMENVPGILAPLAVQDDQKRVVGYLPACIEDVAGDLAEIGYDLAWDCLPAQAFGANHRRDRWFGIAYPEGDAERLQPVAVAGGSEAAESGDDGPPQPVADAEGDGCRPGRTGGSAGPSENGQGLAPEELADYDCVRRVGRTGQLGTRGWSQPAYGGWWATEPDVGRVANGVPHGVDRRRALGNAVCPQVSEHLGRLVMADAEAMAA